MADYIPRILDGELDRRLLSIGAVLIDGPKACGKTMTAARKAHSVIRLDVDANARSLVTLNPEALFDNETPILFDEWQRVPEIWDQIRRHVDDSGSRGLYILTGSATPTDERELHSGAGRIGTLRMRPMSLQESGHSTGEVSLAALLRGEEQRAKATELSVPDLMECVTRGGWPSLIGEDQDPTRVWLTDYLAQIIQVDVPSLGTTRRAPDRLRRLLASLGRSVGQSVKLTSLAAEIAGNDSKTPDVATVAAYLDALDRLMLTENSEPWRPHMRSRIQLREAPVRYFVDPSLGTASLNVGPEDLLDDLNAAGFHFEGLVVRDLRIYSQPLGGQVYSWRDLQGRKEVDAVVDTPEGWAAFEVKLTGDLGVVDEAAKKLLEFSDDVDQTRHGAPRALVVITATGGAGRRADGVHVVPISALGI